MPASRGKCRMRKKAVVIWFFVVLLILGGIASMFAAEWWVGFYLMVMGVFLAFLQALDIRRAARAKQHVCPRCGQIIPEGSKFCTNCEYEIE